MCVESENERERENERASERVREIDKSVLAEASMTAAYMTVTQGMYKYNNKLWTVFVNNK